MPKNNISFQVLNFTVTHCISEKGFSIPEVPVFGNATLSIRNIRHIKNIVGNKTCETVSVDMKQKNSGNKIVPKLLFFVDCIIYLNVCILNYACIPLNDYNEHRWTRYPELGRLG